MKRFRIAILITALAVCMSAVFAFGAQGFQVTKTYPADGAKNTTKDNMCVKVYFSEDVGNAASKAANSKAFRIQDEKGTTYPTMIQYSPKDPKYVLIMIDTTKIQSVNNSKGKNKNKLAIKDNTKYICTIDGSFQSNSGATLGQPVKIQFKTMNQKVNTTVYMVMMFAMFGGMFWFTAKQQKKNKEDDPAQIEEEVSRPFNPYKEAKKTGKSVEEVLAEHEKEEAKLKKKQAKKKNSKKKAQNQPQGPASHDIGNPAKDGKYYRVKRPRPASEGGSTYKTGRAAEAEARRKKEAEAKALRKATNYGKNPLPKEKQIPKAARKRR